MEKYGDDRGVGDEATVVTGPNVGKVGIVKTAAGGVLVLRTADGSEVRVEEDQVTLRPGPENRGVKGS